MRKLIFLALVVSVVSAGGASAQFLGQMSPASTLASNSGKLGGYFVTAEDAFAVVGSFRYGFSEYAEGRLRFGFIDQDGPKTDPHIILGVDAKYMLWKFRATGPEPSSEGRTYQNPIDLSLGFGMEYAVLEWSDVLGIGGSVIASRPFPVGARSSIEPFARLNLRYERVEYDDYFFNNEWLQKDSESDFEVGFNIGGLFSVTDLVDFTAEFQIDEQIAFMLGIDVAAF